ncbi:MAG: hypothetical protein AAGF95_32450 [Chloroflexota bacterium]
MGWIDWSDNCHNDPCIITQQVSLAGGLADATLPPSTSSGTVGSKEADPFGRAWGAAPTHSIQSPHSSVAPSIGGPATHLHSRRFLFTAPPSTGSGYKPLPVYGRHTSTRFSNANGWL